MLIAVIFILEKLSTMPTKYRLAGAFHLIAAFDFFNDILTFRALLITVVLFDYLFETRLYFLLLLVLFTIQSLMKSVIALHAVML